MFIKSAITFLVAAAMVSAGPLANPDPAALTKRGCYYSDVLGGAYFYCGSKDGHDALVSPVFVMIRLSDMARKY